jgi:hypothetical protein
VHGADAGAGHLQAAYGLPRRLDQGLARLGEDHAAADAVEEGAAQVLLQRADGLGEGGLGDVERLGGAVEAAVVHDGEKVLKLPHVHAAPASRLPDRLRLIGIT